MLRLLCLAVLALALGLPAAAFAQDSPFGPLPAAPPTETPVPTVTPAGGGTQGDTPRSTVLLIGGALVLLFAVIGTVVVRDARRRLPGDERGRGPRLRDQGPHRVQRQAKAKARAKGRAARRARKRTTRNR